MNNLVEEAVQFIRAGQKPAGRRILIQYLRSNPRDEVAWIWLAYSMDTEEQSAITLRQYLKINPTSQAALQALDVASRQSNPEGLTLPAPDLSFSPSNLIEKTQPVKIVPNPSPASNPATSEQPVQPASLQSDDSTPIEVPQPLLHGTVPAPTPRKLPRFWVILSILAGLASIAAIGYFLWLWANGRLADFSLPGSSFSTVSSSTWTPPVITPELSGSPTPRPSPTRTMPPALWNVDDLPVISNTNAEKVGRLISWPDKAVYSLSPGWKEMASFDGNEIEVWNIPHHTRLLTISDPAEAITDFGYLPNSRFLVTASQQQHVKVWNLDTGELIRTLDFSPDDLAAISNTVQSAYSEATFLSFSPDGVYIGAVTYGLATIWDTQTGKLVRTIRLDPVDLETFSLEGPNAQIDLLFSPDEENIAYRAIGKITEVNILTGEIIHSFLAPGALGISYSPDGNILLEAGNGYMVLWDLNSGDDFLYIKGCYNADYVPNTAAFSPDGKWLALEACQSNSPVEVQLWNIQTRQKRYSFPSFTARINTLDFSPDGSLLAAGGSENISRIWTTLSGEELVQFVELNGILFSASGQELVGFRKLKLEILGIAETAGLLGITPTVTPSPTGTQNP